MVPLIEEPEFPTSDFLGSLWTYATYAMKNVVTSDLLKAPAKAEATRQHSWYIYSKRLPL